MRDVRTRRGADITSDHHLAVSEMKLKLKKHWNQFKVAFNSRFHALHGLLKEEEITMEGNRISIKEAIISTCQEVLGLEKEWISIETLDKKGSTKRQQLTIAEKVKAQAEYIEANKQVKKSIKADKQKYVKELATTAEKVSREGNMKQLYDTTKKLAGRYSKQKRPAKDKEGRPTTEIQEQRNRWVEHFKELE
ncbi:unnamed protein product [Schistosoma curassoni]|uniref:Transposase n=1 Tax=Schistosoma curassoni TaxID=6186 RepID=A0A183KMC3_9TREM|nr:unnamed protein product [Schistosoma curassoni]